LGIAQEEIRRALDRGLRVDYSGYGLDYNPFPASGIAPDSAKIEDMQEFLGKYMCEKVRETEIKDLVDRLVSIGYVDRAPGHTWIWGEWRVGKSTVLMKVFTALREELKDAVVVYSPKPRYGIIKSIMYYFLRGYDPPFFEDLAKRTLTKLLVENTNLVKTDWIEVWKESVADLKEKSIDESRKYLIDRIRQGDLDVFPLVQDEEAIDSDRLRSIAISRLSQTGVTEKVIDLLINPQIDAETRHSEILRLEKGRDFAEHLVALLQACLYCDYKHVFIFLDDLEDVVRLWAVGKQTKEIDGLNDLLNRMHSGLSIIGTMHAEIFPAFEIAHPRFVGRASGDPLNFSLVRADPLELPDLLETVAFLLSKASKEARPYPTYPFKDEVLKELHGSFQGKLGFILPSLFYLLRMGAEEGQRSKRYPEIDLSFYEKRKGDLGKISE